MSLVRKFGFFVLWAVLSLAMFRGIYSAWMAKVDKTAIPLNTWTYDVGRFMVPVHANMKQGKPIMLVCVAERSPVLKSALDAFLRKENKGHNEPPRKTIDQLIEMDPYYLSVNRYNPIISEEELGGQYSLCQLEELRGIPELRFPWSSKGGGRRKVLPGLELWPPRPGDPPAGSIRIYGQAINSGVVLWYSIEGNRIINPSVVDLSRRVVVRIFYPSLAAAMLGAGLVLLLVWSIVQYFGHRRREAQGIAPSGG